MTKNATIIKNGIENEVRCYSCGKLLFKFTKNNTKTIDNNIKNVKIVARCTRNSCKCDNLLDL